jgi:hypothetical protein
MVVGVQIQGREPDGRYNPAGGARASSVAARTGDVQSALFLEPESRKIGSWFFAAPAVLARPSKRRKVKKTGGTRSKAQQDKIDAPRQVGVLPIHSGFRADTRYKEVRVQLHKDAPDLPGKTPGIILAGTREDEQDLHFFPQNDGTLISVNAAGDADLSSDVFDVTPEDVRDEQRQAPLHTFTRVVKLDGGLGGLHVGGAIAWQLALSGRDSKAGRGLVVDSPGTFEPAALTGGDTGAFTELAGPDAGAFSLGAVTLVSDLIKKQADQIKANQAQDLRDEGLGQTQEREKVNSETKPQTDAEKVDDPEPTPPPAARPAYIIAASSARASGPLEVGDENDIHRLGLAEGGSVPCNSLHISCDALYKNATGDGPLDFEAAPLEEETGSPFFSPCHIRWDPEKTHTWVGGTAPGRWTIQAETPFYVPEEKDEPPVIFVDITININVVNPVIIVFPPPDCMTLPGGQGRDALDGSDGGGIGRTHEDAGDVFVPGTGAQDVGPMPTAVGMSNPATANAGAAHEQNLAGNFDPFPLTPTSPDGTDTASESTPGNVVEGTRTGPTSPARPPDSLERDPGPETSRDIQKARGRGFSALERLLGTPSGSITIGGLENVPPKVRAELTQRGVLDKQGRLLGVTPKVGDSEGMRRILLGGLLSRTPTSASNVRAGGFQVYRAFSTAKGESDLTCGGMIEPAELLNQVRAPDVVALGAWGLSNTGQWGDLETEGEHNPGSPRNGPGGLCMLPSRLASAGGLADVLAGEYRPGTGGQTATAVSLSLPGGLSQLDLAHPTGGGTADGVRLRQAVGSEGGTALLAAPLGVDGVETEPALELSAAGGLKLGGESIVSKADTVAAILVVTDAELGSQILTDGVNVMVDC